mmetsp:Transcript_73685/g.85595  ORF Transcript_73685/g.85595 Transcript_73685/m.85595 type:complete len:125 (-) Transcript_73685:143-517(-)
MPIYDETWEEGTYAYSKYQNLKALTKNHVGRLSTLKFDFVEYKTNHQVACHLYERMTILCRNQYGLFKDSQLKECMDAQYMFKQCIKLHTAVGVQKKYWPELFASSPYSRPSLQPSELYLGGSV